MHNRGGSCLLIPSLEFPFALNCDFFSVLYVRIGASPELHAQIAYELICVFFHGFHVFLCITFEIL